MLPDNRTMLELARALGFTSRFLSEDGVVEVRMSLDSPGRTSVMSRYELRAGERRVADGAAKIVWIDLASGRPTPLPTRVRSLFESGGATWA